MVEVINGNVEKALRDVSRMLQINGVISEVKARARHVKPCEARSLRKAKRMANIRKHTSQSRLHKHSSRSSVSIFSTSLV